MAPEIVLGVVALVSIAANVFLVIVLARVTHRLLSQNNELQLRDIAVFGTPAAEEFVRGARAHDLARNQRGPAPDTEEALPFAR